MTAPSVGASDIGVEIEAGLAFGTGHHGTTRGCLLHFDRLLKRRRPRRVLDVGCGAGVLAIAAAKVAAAQSLARRHRSCRGRGRQRQCAPQRRRRACRAIVSRGVEARALREGAPYDLVFANILAKPLRLLAPSLAAVLAPDGEAIVSGLLLADVAGVLASGARRGFTSPNGSTSKAGRACG